MLALTVWQPWASLIACGVKPYEFRSWPAPKAARGQRIAIHAAARQPRRDEIAHIIEQLEGAAPWCAGLSDPQTALTLLYRWLRDPGRLYRSIVICSAVLGEPVRASKIMNAFGAPVDASTDFHAAYDWAWPLSDVRRIQPSETVKGAQGFWEWGQGDMLSGGAQ